MRKKKYKVTILPDKSCFAVVDVNDAVDFMEKMFGAETTPKKIKKQNGRRRTDKR